MLRFDLVTASCEGEKLSGEKLLAVAAKSIAKAPITEACSLWALGHCWSLGKRLYSATGLWVVAGSAVVVLQQNPPF